MAINKRLLAKRDMNFFAEFTANAAKMRRLFGYAVVIGVIVVGVLLAIVGYDLIRNALIKAEITSLKIVLESDEYAHLEERAEELARELEEKQNHYYALTQMRKQVDTINAAPEDLPETLAKCIPSDTYISKYDITSNDALIEGYTFSYYSAVDLVHMLQESDVYTTIPQLDITIVDPSSLGGIENFIWEANATNTQTNNNNNNNNNQPKLMCNPINNYYKFEIKGALVGEVYISVGRYANGASVTSLAGIETIPVKVGNQYVIPDVATYTTGGVTYNLSKIMVNNQAVDANSLSGAIANNQITGQALNNMEIGLYYDKPVEQPAEGGEGK